MFPWFKTSSDRFVGISLHAYGAAAVVACAQPGNTLALEQLHWVDDDSGDAATLLQKLIAAVALKSLPVVVVMAPDSYALVQLEAPDVPAEDMADALRWRVKDMIDFPVQDSVLQSFALPESRRPGAPHLMYAVAAPKARIDALVKPLKRAGAKIRAVDVPELALRDLIMHNGNNERVHGYLHLQKGMALIEICGADEIYLTRHIPLSDGGAGGIFDSLVLEVQRSLDYFESQYAVGAVDQLYVLAEDEDAEVAFKHAATTYLTVPVVGVALEPVKGMDKFPASHVRRAMLAIGAAIREMPCAA